MPFFKLLGLAACALSFSVSANISEVQKNAEKAIEQAKKSGWLEGLKLEEVDETQLEKARELSNIAVSISQKATTQDRMLGEGQQKPDLLEHSNGAIFISFSMSRKELITAFKEAAEHNYTILLRGMIEGSSHVMQTMKAVKVIAAAAKVEPNVGIDPSKFSDHEINAVPTIVKLDTSKTIKVPGTLSVEYVARLAKEHSESYTSNPVGAVYDIKETDMVEQMKAAAANIDWKQKQKAAVERFWKKYETYQLPTAREDKQWVFDPTVRVTKDITNGRGDVLATAGQVINPLKTIDARLSIMIINPYVEGQIDWAKEQMNKQQGMFEVLITHIDKDKGWEDYTRFRKTMSAPLYVLPKQLIERFRVTATPALIQTRSDGLMQVRQYKWDQSL